MATFFECFNSRVLRKSVEPVRLTQLDKEERSQIEQDFQSWLNEMKSSDEEFDEKHDEDAYYSSSSLRRTKQKLTSRKKLADEKEEEEEDDELAEKCIKYDNENLPPIRRTVIFNDEPALRVSSSI
ncbi:unnamed protein product [Trichobilharzia regenti]|nr:unnamed protein product [Trichobilharzia regenti]